jgi:AcrR family transcriptional regulator
MAKAKTSKKPKPAMESSTEERIKEAARKLFTQKGFAATRTRDIAEEAGINLALLNYYFRSKQKLFDLVMMENFQQFIKGITVNFTDETMTFDQRIERIVVAYVDMLTRLPDLPMFILNEIRGNPSKIAAKLQTELAPMRQNLFKQLIASNKEGKTDLEPFHFVANLVGLTVFPFIGRPILQRVTGVTDDQFEQYMQDRKELVPIWIRAMLTPPGIPGIPTRRPSPSTPQK